MLDKRSHVPLYIQLRNEILQKIRDEIWPTNSQIPTEKALMAEYGVGRATVREAISTLENEGYLIKRQGIGTFVARSQPSFGFEPLISLTYSLKAKGIHSHNVIHEKRVITPDADILAKMRSQGMAKCLYLKRHRYANEIPIAIEDSYFSETFADIDERHDLTGSLARLLLRDLNVTIQQVEQVVVPRVPTGEEQEILKINSDVLVLAMERWIYCVGQSEPFYYLNFVIPSNIYSFSGF
jgi:GntR family transcriptional regulator